MIVLMVVYGVMALATAAGAMEAMAEDCYGHVDWLDALRVAVVMGTCWPIAWVAALVIASSEGGAA